MNVLKLSLAALALAVTVGLAACGDSKPAVKTLKIAVIPKGTTSEYWKIVHAGAVKAKMELQATQPIEIIYKGSLKEDQSAEEISVVEDMFNNKVDAIVLAPNNADALSPIVDTAAKKGIPVVIIDSAVKTDTYKSFVATDNKKGGYMGGKELAKELGGKGKVIMLRYQEGSASTEEREQGFLDAMKEAGITPVDVAKHGGVTAAACQTVADNLLAAYKNPDGTLSIDGIFCPNYPTTFGMLRSLEEAKLIGKVKFVGFDSDVTLAQAVKDKKIGALVVQDPINMGYLGVKTAVDLANGKKVERTVDTGVHLVTVDNVNTPESKEILTPDISKYLKD